MLTQFAVVKTNTTSVALTLNNTVNQAPTPSAVTTTKSTATVNAGQRTNHAAIIPPSTAQLNTMLALSTAVAMMVKHAAKPESNVSPRMLSAVNTENKNVTDSAFQNPTFAAHQKHHTANTPTSVKNTAVMSQTVTTTASSPTNARNTAVNQDPHTANTPEPASTT